ncbi:ubiquitin fusion degradation protein 1 [Fistulifera solaris]|uniref:Ubiquitin fusion degradation protein 1 n=1 Tax=Fistulifera solaris TaxID=1519565 RepID=A0A1Z5KFL5_FISSO|nr:ubiquitin fusion degradation protein 1 [Fistulifera solaris]|eukprot:GAX25083.1 ubiquitin fusion degradation protein 1 [Fistulifera solaris]
MLPGWGFAGPAVRHFEEQYHCYSVAAADKAHLERGDKILLPPSAFDTLARLNVDYPMLFQLTAASSRRTHSGVLEFTAEEGCCYIPYWMMQNLLIEEGSLITVKNISLPKATFVKLQPQSVDFLEISNPKAVLEHALRNFSCVTLGDVIQIQYNDKNYHLALQQVQPADAACIIETDCQVDFDAPVGYVEPERPTTTTEVSNISQGDNNVEAPDEKATGIRIVNGQIVRPESNNNSKTTEIPLAERLGATGVQKNAAIPEEAPAVDYWALQSEGARRLDGKAPAPLVDASGKEVDIRALRAEAAAKRLLVQQTASSMNGSGRTTSATNSASETPPSEPIHVESKRKSRIAGKYSKLKSSSAFQGSANQLK